MGFLSSLCEFVFDLFESAAKSDSQKRYNYAQDRLRDKDLSDLQRQKLQEMKVNAKNDIEHLRATQAKRDEFKKQIFKNGGEN